MAKSPIEWCDFTFNPWVGCTKISPACDNCYAEGWARRTGQAELWTGERRRTTPANWRQPLKWDQQSAAQVAAGGRRLRVFCASLADVFDNQVPDDWRADLWALIRATPNLDWQLLTKRPQNIARMLPPDWGDGWPHVWLGTTVEAQERADRNIPYLLDTPAAVRFLSVEPLLGAVDLQQIAIHTPRHSMLGPFERNDTPMLLNALTGHVSGIDEIGARIDWVIVGGESGPNARPMHPDWARQIRDQCAAAGVPFLFKQWGEYVPMFQAGYTCWTNKTPQRPGYRGPARGACSGSPTHTDTTCITKFSRDGTIYVQIGKKAAGRTLDGVTHDAFPASPAGALEVGR